MTKVSVNQAYQAALSAGFSKAEAVVMVATAEVENSLDLSTSTGNGGGLLQFEPNTWPSGLGCDRSSLTCQMMAARQVTKSNFTSVWYNTWYKWEAQQGGMTPQHYAQIMSGVESTLGVPSTGAVSLLGEATNTTSSDFPSPGGIISGIGSGISSGVSSVIGIPGKLVGGAIGGVAGDIGGGIASGLTSVGERLLPYLLILSAMVIVFFLLIHDIQRQKTSTPPSSQSSGAMMVPVE